jgi:hypothetical protein
MLKYYLMAIEKNFNVSIYNLGVYYEKQKDYDNMIKYYLMAGTESDNKLLKYIVDHYILIKDYDNIMNYFWTGFRITNYVVIEKVIGYLLKNNQNIKTIMEIYALCCNDIQYEAYLDDIKKLIKIKQIQYFFIKLKIEFYKYINY